MMRQSTTHSFHFDSDVTNVMYFDHDDSLFIDDANDNAVQVHGIKPSHLIQLARNFFVTDHINVASLKSYQKNSLKEIVTAINSLLEE